MKALKEASGGPCVFGAEGGRDDSTAARFGVCPMIYSLSDASPMAVVMLDLKGGVAFWSKSAENIFGWESEEVLGRLPPIVPKEKRDEFLGNFNRILEGGNISGLECPGLRKDGKFIDMSLSASPMKNRQGEIVLIMTLVQDISDKKCLEREFQQAQKMEAVGRLAGGVAHDFNNLLTAIAGYSTFLLKNLSPDDPNRPDVEEIKKAGERAAELTRQLLAFSRQQVLQLKILDCNRVVAGIEKMFRRLIGEDIQVISRLRPELGAVKADPGQMEQVLMNLVVNSRDAMPEGGTITIETSNESVDHARARAHPGLKPGSYVLVAVSDTGCGMDAQTQARLFEPFFTTKELGKGTGLGLATVYGIVSQSGGNIFVHSKPGGGTTFNIYLPRVDDEACAAIPAALPPQSLHGSETILLVEDDDSVYKLLRRVLSGNGYTVLAASSGDSALMICERYKGDIHLMLTDIVMPRMNGRELAKRLSPLRPNMKVIYMSGYTEKSIFQHDLLAGRELFLQKPLEPELVLRKVREILNRG